MGNGGGGKMVHRLSRTKNATRREILSSGIAIASASAMSLPASAIAASTQFADTIYSGGEILTMKGKKPQYTEALAVRDGKIAYVGSKAGAFRLKSDHTKVVDLKGKVLLPGFIDAHGHMLNFGKNLVDCDLFGAKDIADVVERMKAHIAKIPGDAWIVGFGYSLPVLAEHRHPTAAELDQISSGRPILVSDSSGHQGSMNSALMKLADISATTEDPQGGVFVRVPGTKEPLGPMEETALLGKVRPLRPPFAGVLADKVMTEGAALWAAYGQTTAMECGLGLGPDDISIVKNAIDKNLLPIDLVVFAKESATSDVIDAAYGVGRDYDAQGVGNAEKILASRPDLNKRYVNRVRLGGIKFWLDGSIPTAWMSKPYSTPPAGQPADYVAYRQIPDQMLLEFFDKFWKSSMQINMHVNGDAAAEQALLAIEAAIKKHGRSDHRPVFVHASYMRPDQIERMRAVGGIPSYLSAALPGAGDTVLKLWGPERASHSMAANTMIQKGMRFTLSHDAPITPRPVILPLLDAAVNRASASGSVIGPKERITPYQALLGVTNYAAYQIKEEGAKGTLEVGKLADLVILDKNPLKVDPTTIKNIGVVETIKEGKSIYRADGKVGHFEGLARTLFAFSGHAAQDISFGPCPGCQMIAYKKRMANSTVRTKFECV